MGKMTKSIKDRESELFNQRGYTNTSSILPIRDKKRNNSYMKELYDLPSAKNWS
jgi:hypothetical protein